MASFMTSYVYPNRFIGIISSDSYNSDFYKLSLFADNHDKLVKVAVGKETTLEKLCSSFRSAETALKSMTESGQSLAIFDNLTLEILLSDLKPEIISEYTEKVLSRLSQNDIEFLKVYYSENQSLQKTAEKLFLHKNTVQQRLNKISDISGYNPRKFTDAVCLYMGIAFS